MNVINLWNLRIRTCERHVFTNRTLKINKSKQFPLVLILSCFKDIFTLVQWWIQLHTWDGNFYTWRRTLTKTLFTIQTLCLMFDTYVNSTLSYGSEIWGFHRAQDVEKVYLSFCKNKMHLWNTMPPIIANSNEGKDHKDK